MPGRFKDYIAIPRVNGYQSLHTTLFGPNGMPIEVQIRTEDMHRVAEAGIAAHWKYKADDERRRAQDDRAREWLANLVDMQEGGSSEEFLESVKVDLFPDKVYVFTPQGRDPAPAARRHRASTSPTPCTPTSATAASRPRSTGASRRCARRCATARRSRSSPRRARCRIPSWVNFVVTAKARAAIRHYLKGLRRQEAVELGARLLNQALGEFTLSLEEVAADTLNAAVVELGMHDVDELYEKVGLGERLAPLVARRLLPDARPARNPSPARPRRSPSPAPKGCWSSYARCCFPIPDDADLRVPVRAAAAWSSIARTACNVEDYRKHPENWLPVAWQATTDKVFSSEIRVDVANKMGVLAAVAAAISLGDTNIERVAVEEKDADSSSLVFELRVRNRKHLARVVQSDPPHARSAQGHAYNRQPRSRQLARLTSSARSLAMAQDFDNDDNPQAIHTDKAPKAIGPYSQAVRVGDTVYLAGQIPLDPATMQMVEGDFEKEATPRVREHQGRDRRSRRHVPAGREGHDLPHRLRELREGQRAHGEVLHRAVPGAFRRSAVAALPRNARVEIECTLHLG